MAVKTAAKTAAKPAARPGRSGSLQSPPLVIRQSRQHALRWAVVGGAVLWVGLSGYFGNDVIDGFIPESVGITYAGTLVLAVALIACSRPSRISFSSAGFRHRMFFSTRLVNWNEIAGVHGRTTVKGKPNGVAITLTKGQPMRLAGKWPVSSDELDRLIRQARREWSR